MGNWLAPLKNGLMGGGPLGIAHQDLGNVIREGADIVLRYKRNPLMPRWKHEPPISGIPVIRDEPGLEMFLAASVSASVKQMQWGRHRFYYETVQVPHIQTRRPWSQLVMGLARHEIEPLLTHTPDVWVFDGLEWSLCEIRLALN